MCIMCLWNGYFRARPQRAAAYFDDGDVVEGGRCNAAPAAHAMLITGDNFRCNDATLWLNTEGLKISIWMTTAEGQSI